MKRYQSYNDEVVGKIRIIDARLEWIQRVIRMNLAIPVWLSQIEPPLEAPVLQEDRK